MESPIFVLEIFLVKLYGSLRVLFAPTDIEIQFQLSGWFLPLQGNKGLVNIHFQHSGRSYTPSWALALGGRCLQFAINILKRRTTWFINRDIIFHQQISHGLHSTGQ
jgi:hypothetical protein